MNFKRIILQITICIIGILNLKAQNNYKYKLDLVNVTNDQVNVELVVPKIKKNRITFYFAKIIPGTYQVYDFGRFVSNFMAYDENGNFLEVIRKDDNTFIINKSKALYKITYTVDDTYDSNEGKKVSGMSGTNIEADKNFVLNGHGFYGYFEGMKQLEYEIKILKPKGFEGSSAINILTRTETYDTYKMPSFNFVVDTPMMYCIPDQTIKKLGNSEVLVSVYSPSKNVSSDYLSDKLNKLLEAQKNYMGGKLPVDKYAFLMYFLSPDQHMVTGALEHNYSSLYALPDLPQEQIIQPILNISAHEFFHVITPLSIHSKEIQYFDFNNPDMSKHLWMYEGVTEYFAHHAQLVGSLTSLEQFLEEIANKITTSVSNFNDELPFTDLSLGCLDKYRNEYGNVYQKGALIGLCLDIYLRKYSNGDRGLIDLMNQLAKKYDNDKPFEDNLLFKEIVSITYPGIKSFFTRYVDGNEPLPLYAVLKELGIDYKAPEAYLGFSLGGPSLGYNPSTKIIYVADIGGLNDFGKKVDYRVGDELISINGEKLPESGFHQYFQNITNNLKGNDTLNILVRRNGNNIQLSAKVEKVKLYKPAIVTINPNATREQLNLRYKWTKGAM